MTNLPPRTGNQQILVKRINTCEHERKHPHLLLRASHLRDAISRGLRFSYDTFLHLPDIFTSALSAFSERKIKFVFYFYLLLLLLFFKAKSLPTMPSLDNRNKLQSKQVALT